MPAPMPAAALPADSRLRPAQRRRDRLDVRYRLQVCFGDAEQPGAQWTPVSTAGCAAL